MLPMPYFFKQSENILGFSAFVSFERFEIGVKVVRKRCNIILNFFQNDRTDVELYINFIIFILVLRRVILVTYISYLQFYFTELCDNVMEAIA